jgi:hypothetical protein
MKLFPKTLVGAALAAVCQFFPVENAAAQGSPNLYQVFLSSDGVTTNDFSRLVGTFAGARELIRQCASENGLSSSQLTLVYDRDTDALEVVNRTNGVVVCSPITFSGGNSVTNGSGTARERLAFVYLADSSEAAGTVRALERYVYNRDGEVVRFSLTAKLQYAVAGEDKRTKIYTAFLMTGGKFVPWNY